MLTKIINLSAIKHNASVVKKAAGTRKVCAVVKSNAYGMGAERVVLALNNLVDFFAVASSDEAKKIVNLTAKPILVLTPCEQVLAGEKNVHYTVASLADIKLLEKTGEAQGVRIGVHIKLDTGMCRLGLSCAKDFVLAVNYIKRSRWLVLKGVYTHFASCNKSNLKKQNNLFKSLLACVKLPKRAVVHSASSYALISGYKTAGNMVRVGIALYGGIGGRGFAQVLTCFGKVVCIKNLYAGDSIGYDGTYKLKTEAKIAVVNVGYFDGVNRLLSASSNSENKKYFYINGHRCQILGRISMNLISVNVSGVKNLTLGDRAYLVKNLSDLQRLAKSTGTIVYEILTSLKNCDTIYT